MILITGASGFIGREVLAALHRKYPREKIIALYHKRKPALNFSNVRWLRADLTQAKDLVRIPKNFRWLFHLASFVPKNADESYSEKNFQVNVAAAANLVALCSQNPALEQIILSSSISVYGKAAGKLGEQRSGPPENCYGLSKLFSENIFLAVKDQKPQVRIAILRYSSVYGPGQHSGTVLPIFITRAKKGEPLTVFERGLRFQDFVHVKDVAAANVLAAQKRADGVFNIGSGRRASMKWLAIQVQRYFGRSKIVMMPKKETRPSQVLDIQRAKKILDYEPRVDMNRGLKWYAASLREK